MKYNKLMVATDLHGGITSGKRVIELFEAQHADKLVLCGDFYYHGPRNPLPNVYSPMDLNQLLNNHKDDIVAIRGNCDAEIDQTISLFPFEESVTMQCGNCNIVFQHGHRLNPTLFPRVDAVVFRSHSRQQYNSLRLTDCYCQPCLGNSTQRRLPEEY